MPGPWKAWKTKSGFPTLSTVPWKSRRKREIPTFPPPGFASMEKWKTKSRFPTFPRPLATITTVLSLKTKNQRKEVGRCAASSFPVRFSCSSFDWKMLCPPRPLDFRLQRTLKPASPDLMLYHANRLSSGLPHGRLVTHVIAF